MRYETDDELRDRLFYVTGDHRVGSMQGKQLDDFAWQYNLSRRVVRIP